MTEEGPRRRFQFNLRQTLLWTVVAAIWLGFLEVWIGETSVILELSWWAGVVGIVRIALGLKMAVLTTVGIGASLIMFHYHYDPGGSVELIYYLILTGVFASVIFVLVEVAFHAVHWTDQIIDRKTTRRD